MKTGSIFCLGVIIGISSFLLVGCDQLPSRNDETTNWLKGTWVVDRDKSTEIFINATLSKINIKNEGGGLLGQLGAAAAKEAAKNTIAKMLGPMDHLKFHYTDSEYSKTGPGLSGDPAVYEILGRPAPNQITVRHGDIERTYHKDGRNIWYVEETYTKAKIYLTPSN